MLKKILLVCLAMMTVLSSGCSYLNFSRQSPPMVASEYKSLGIPTLENYPSDFMSRYPYDMYYYDGKVYIGAGDYDKNTGPIDVWAYNHDTEEWENSGTVPDEAVMRFVEIDGKLIIPGTDPRESWDWGNYYVLNDTGWEKVRTIPNGIHNFDMVKFQDRLFAAIGTKSGNMPIVVSDDDGKTFKQVQMLKNGDLINTYYDVVRAYDFFELNGILYATYVCHNNDGSGMSYELYSYQDGEFSYHANMYDLLSGRNDLGGNVIRERITHKNKLFIVTGHLIFTEDMEIFTSLTFPKKETVYDVLVYESSIYALCGIENEDGNFVISVWKNESENATGFKQILYFEYEIPAVSFAFSGDFFYFGMHNNGTHKENGTILEVAYVDD